LIIDLSSSKAAIASSSIHVAHGVTATVSEIDLSVVKGVYRLSAVGAVARGDLGIVHSGKVLANAFFSLMGSRANRLGISKLLNAAIAGISSLEVDAAAR